MCLVSVIIPTFNSENTIEETITSVVQQTFMDYEILVVDGGSTDNTLHIIEKYAQKYKQVTLIKNLDDLGPAHSRLVGIKKSKSKYIAFLDSDDLWDNMKLEFQINFMEDKGYGFTFTDYQIIDEVGKVISPKISGHTANSYQQYLRRRGIANSSVVLRRELIKGLLDSAIHPTHAEDTLWWLLLLKGNFGLLAVRVPECLLSYRYSPSGRSRERLKNQIDVWKIYRHQLSLSVLKTLWCYTGYLLDVSVRKAILLSRMKL